MAKNLKKKNVEKTILVSFKVSETVYKQISNYAETQTDETGLKLSPSLGARRLMLQALKKMEN